MPYQLKKTGTVLKTGTITGTETPDGYELAATDFLSEARIRRARPKERRKYPSSRRSELAEVMGMNRRQS